MNNQIRPIEYMFYIENLEGLNTQYFTKNKLIHPVVEIDFEMYLITCRCPALMDFHFDDGKLLQYTGFIDKYANKLYEGDVIEYTAHPGYMWKSFDAEIIWMSEYGCFAFRNEKGITKFADNDEFRHDVLPYIKKNGNKYINPELLHDLIPF